MRKRDKEKKERGGAMRGARRVEEDKKAKNWWKVK